MCYDYHQIENGEKMQTTKIKFLDLLAFLNTSLETLSVNLKESDKSSLSDYLTYKCLVKFRGIDDTNLLYEGRHQYDDEVTELINESNVKHYCSSSQYALQPSDDHYRNRIYDSIILTANEQEWFDKAMALVKKKGEFP